MKDHTWRVTSFGHWIIASDCFLQESALALSKVMEPLLHAIEDNPEKLSELLPQCSCTHLQGGERRQILQAGRGDAEADGNQPHLIHQRYPAAIEAIWGEGVERMIGGFSSLLAVILLHRLSLAQDYRTQTSLVETIPKIVDQYFKSLSVELSEFLTNSLADLNKLATLDRKVKADRSRQMAKKTGR